VITWSSAPGALLGIDASLFVRIDGMSGVHELAEMIGETDDTVREALARLEARGLLAFLPAGPGMRIEEPEEIAELDEEVAPDPESSRDTLPEGPPAPLLQACAPARSVPRRPPPLPARARAGNAGRGKSGQKKPS